MESAAKPFFGRENLVREIVQGILSDHPQDFALVAPKYCGKTLILDRLAAEDGPLRSRSNSSARPERFQDASRIIILSVDCKRPEIKTHLLKHLADTLNSRLREERPFAINWDQIRDDDPPSRTLLALASQANQAEFRVVLLLNNFDAVLEGKHLEQAQLNELRPLTSDLALIVGSRQPLHDIDIELASSSLFHLMRTLFVGLLEEEAALQWIASYRQSFPELSEELDASLANITGRHPYLLARLRETLLEVRKMLPAGKALDLTDFQLITLRLAEHGQILFETLRQTMQEPPPRAPKEAVDDLLGAMTDAPIPQTAITPQQRAAVSWLINQAVVIYENQSYRLFTPLFADFLRQQSSSPRAKPHPPITPTTSAPASTHTAVLPRIEADLLQYFSQHANQVLSSQELLVAVWKLPASTSDRRVQEAIRRLRNYLKGQTPPIGVIENERGQGYCFIPVQETEK
jgi:hypothetical protein